MPNYPPGDHELRPSAHRLDQNRHVVVGQLCAPGIVRAVLTGPDRGQHEAALASGWFVFHYRGKLRTIVRGTVTYPTTAERYTLTGYDANGTVVTD